MLFVIKRGVAAESVPNTRLPVPLEAAGSDLIQRGRDNEKDSSPTSPRFVSLCFSNEMKRGGSGHTAAKAQDNVGSAAIGDGFLLRMPEYTCWWEGGQKWRCW
jgi:hypothetical protein